MKRHDEPTLIVRAAQPTVIAPPSQTIVGVAPPASMPAGTPLPQRAAVVPPAAYTIRPQPPSVWDTPRVATTVLLAAGETPRPGGRVDQYEILDPIGAGGMGTVFLAWDLRLDRHVAIKFLQAHQLVHAQRFLVEARTTARCSHPNIVVIHDVGEHDGVPYMVLEYLSGKPLTNLLEHNARVSYPRAIDIMCSVLSALRCAHGQGIVHRDLKPGNIFITDNGTIKVLDFGIAKILQERVPSPLGIVADRAMEDSSDELAGEPGTGLTKVGTIVGTYEFMAPEQWGIAIEIDHLSDIWASGILLHRMICGRHPLAPLEGNQLVVTGNLEIPMPSMQLAAPPEVPRELIRIVDRCLLKQKEQRWQTAAELLTALQPFLSRSLTQDLQLYNNPYIGQSAFQENDADRFFGRDREIPVVVTQVRNRPITAIVGDSGVGKSSFVRAGLIAKLKASDEAWETWIARPGGRPLETLAGIVVPLLEALDPADCVHQPAQLVEKLRLEPHHLVEVLRSHARRTQRRILVFIDQVEELYMQVHDRAETAAFIAALAALADDSDDQLRLVLAIRSDFFDQLVGDDVSGHLTSAPFFLGPPTREDLRDALVGPAKNAGFQFESAAAIERILDHLGILAEGSMPRPRVGALPLLQLVTAALWETRNIGRRSFTGWTTGRFVSALAAHADQFVANLDEGGQALFRALVLRFVTPKRTRATVPVGELRLLAHDADGVGRMLEDMIDARLLVVQTLDGAATMELIHESLFGWPLLTRWLDENENDLLTIHRLQATAHIWHQTRSVGLLWRDDLAADARRFRTHYKGPLDDAERAFLDAVFELQAGPTPPTGAGEAAPERLAEIDERAGLLRDRNRGRLGWLALIAGLRALFAIVWRAFGGPPRGFTPPHPRLDAATVTTEAASEAAPAAGRNISSDASSPASLRRMPAAPQRRVLHLSDLHFAGKEQATIWYSQLRSDLHQIGAHRLDAVVVSGDIVNRAEPAEYEAARRFFTQLMDGFSLAPRQIVIVPGNHDVNWSLSKRAYRLHRREDYASALTPDQVISHGDVIEVRDEHAYRNRLQAFAQWYRSLKGIEYPLAYEHQATLDELPDLGLCILGLSSVWQLDHHFRDRASIHPEALATALLKLPPDAGQLLRIAVFHHPVQSEEDSRIRDTSFLQQLAVHGFRIALHGHVHKAGNAEYRYEHGESGRRLDIVAAGTFGAATREWVPGYPLQYQLLLIEQDQITVETRCRREVNGAWMPDAQWLQGPGQDPLPRYAIRR